MIIPAVIDCSVKGGPNVICNRSGYPNLWQQVTINVDLVPAVIAPLILDGDPNDRTRAGTNSAREVVSGGTPAWGQ